MTRTGLAAAGTVFALALAGGIGAAWLRFAPGPGGSAGACAAGSAPMQRIELVFGLSRKGRVDVSDGEWAQFLDQEVTPRFPDGLTVLAGSGQWRNATGVVIREPSRVLLVWANSAPDLDTRINAVREAWKSAHQQESVLRADGVGCVGF